MRPRWLAWRRVEVRVLTGFLAAVAGVLVLAKAASEVVEGDTLAFDRAVLVALRRPEDLAIPIGPAWLHETMVQVTALGSFPVLALISLLAVGYLIADRKAGLALFTAGALASGMAAAALLKLVYGRARPEVVAHLVDVTSSSFPSGHAADSAIVYLTLAVLLARAESVRRARLYLISAAIVLSLLIGFSRVYLGVHYPTDVIAGWFVGALWALAASFIAMRLRRKIGNTSPV